MALTIYRHPAQRIAKTHAMCYNHLTTLNTHLATVLRHDHCVYIVFLVGVVTAGRLRLYVMSP